MLISISFWMPVEGIFSGAQMMDFSSINAGLFCIARTGAKLFLDIHPLGVLLKYSRSILQRLSQMRRLDLLTSRQVRDRAG